MILVGAVPILLKALADHGDFQENIDMIDSALAVLSNLCSGGNENRVSFGLLCFETFYFCFFGIRLAVFLSFVHFSAFFSVFRCS
jgi:hypothetical protein